MAVEASVLEQKLRESFPGAEIVLRDTVGDRDHYEVSIVSEAFAGKSRVEQHRMVQRALDGILGTTLHALAMKTSAR
ncbi:MAG: BolA family transcriptional regulator [Alphaproteobacteria bacterium]|nr:BolA family transcriptional regulator [Alphaproteobacteria bacterium]